MADTRLAGDDLRGGVAADAGAGKRTRQWNMRLAKAACAQILNQALASEDPNFHGHFTFHAKEGRIVHGATNQTEKAEPLGTPIDPEDVFGVDSSSESRRG